MMRILRILRKKSTDPNDIDPGDDDPEPDLKEVCRFCGIILPHPCLKQEEADRCVNYRPVVPQPQPNRRKKR